jgi:hypothetical protein
MAKMQRAKGQSGEREVATLLNQLVGEIRHLKGLPALNPKELPFQRNQNQSAVGGSDITNPFSLAIEVKRCETLSINAWWRQCIDQAEREGGLPILFYRKSRQPWTVRTRVHVWLPISSVRVAADISLDDFLLWLREYLEQIKDSSTE